MITPTTPRVFILFASTVTRRLHPVDPVSRPLGAGVAPTPLRAAAGARPGCRRRRRRRRGARLGLDLGLDLLLHLERPHADVHIAFLGTVVHARALFARRPAHGHVALAAVGPGVARARLAHAFVWIETELAHALLTGKHAAAGRPPRLGLFPAPGFQAHGAHGIGCDIGGGVPAALDALVLDGNGAVVGDLPVPLAIALPLGQRLGHLGDVLDDLVPVRHGHGHGPKALDEDAVRHDGRRRQRVQHIVIVGRHDNGVHGRGTGRGLACMCRHVSK